MGFTFLAAGFAETIKGWFVGWSGQILSLFPKAIYALCTLVFSILDILQVLIRKVAGLDIVYYTTNNVSGEILTQSDPAKGDIVYKFIEDIFLGQTPILSNVFWAMIILGSIMLFLTTFIAVLRTEYGTIDSKSSSKAKVIGQAFKAIASFAVVPIVVFFGIYLSNTILQALDSATSGMGTESAGPQSMEQLFIKQNPKTKEINGSLEVNQNLPESYVHYNFYGYLLPTSSTPISGQLFTAAAYRANRIRYYPLFQENLSNENVGAGVFNLLSSDYEKSAALLDDCFSGSYVLKTPQTLDTTPFESDYLYNIFDSESGSFFSNSAVSFQTFDKNNVALVWYYYNLFDFDFILCIGALVVFTKILISLVFGLMKRIFELLILFLISAPIASIMPLDNGAALGNWRKKFIAKTISAYAPIVGLNLLFIILPLVRTIQFFGIAPIDTIVNLFFTIVGLVMVKELVGTIAEIIGGEDAIKSGESVTSAVGETIAKVGKVAATVVGGIVGGVGGAVKFGKFASGQVNKFKNHKAEKGAVLDSIMSNDEKAEEFQNMSGFGQRRTLKRLRLSMSNEDREAAHSNELNKKSYNSYYAGGLRLKASKSGKSASKIKQNNELLEGSVYNEIMANPKSAKAFTKGSYRKKNDMIKKRMHSIYFDKKKVLNVAPGSSEEAKLKKGFDDLSKAKITSFEGTLRGKIQLNKDRYESFNDKIFGASGSDKRVKNEQAIYDQKIKESKESGSLKAKSIAGALGGAVTNPLQTIFKTLGGELSKGFKEAGGWSSWWANLNNVSEKKQGLSAEVKNQKKILAAQREADKLLGATRGGDSKVEISDASAEKLAEAIVQKINP